jgi:Predicted metal-dependent phosphoesterases (PHP family)
MPAGGGCGRSGCYPVPECPLPDHPLRQVLRQLTPSCCPSRVNFHCHTICSDGSLSPRELALQALDLGLEHLAITDHHSLAAHGPALEVFMAAASEGLAVPSFWRGVEISCLLEGCLVHVLVLGFDADHPSLEPYLQGRAVVGPALQAEAVLEAGRQAGGLLLLAHPARYRLPFQRLIAAADGLGF